MVLPSCSQPAFSHELPLPLLAAGGLSLAAAVMMLFAAGPAAKPAFVPTVQALPVASLQGDGEMGKFVERHRDAESEAESAGHGLVVPASALMPMSLEWSAPPSATAVMVRATGTGRVLPVHNAVHVAARPAPAARVVKPLAPLQLVHSAPIAASPVEIALAPPTKPERGVLQWIPNGLVTTGKVIGDTASTVGRAGVWTVSAAASLLPSWN